MKTPKNSQNVSVKNTEHNRGIKKFYDIYCLKSNLLQLNDLVITENLNSHPLSRLDCFESLAQSIIPDLNQSFYIDKHTSLFVSFDRGFFSPFNMKSFYRDYSFNLGYLKDKYSILNDKIPICLVQVYQGKPIMSLTYRYVFFVKEVCNG